MKILTYLITSFRAHHLIRLAIICLDHENCRYSKYIFQQYTYIVTCIYVSIREITTIPFLIMDLLQMLLLYMYLFKYFISTFISLSSNQNWKCSLRKKEETPIQCQSIFKLFEILKGWYILFPNISLKKKNQTLYGGFLFFPQSEWENPVVIRPLSLTEYIV